MRSRTASPSPSWSLPTGHISGRPAFNPAVVVALLIARKITPVKGAIYIVAQLIGAALGTFLATLIFPADALAKVGYGNPAVGNGFSAMNALIAEIVTTFFLAYVIFGVAIDKRGPLTIASLMIGLTIVIDILATGGISGAAMNPARWFGTAIISGNFADAWIWWVGPIAGASLAALSTTTATSEAEPRLGVRGPSERSEQWLEREVRKA